MLPVRNNATFHEGGQHVHHTEGSSGHSSLLGVLCGEELPSSPVESAEAKEAGIEGSGFAICPHL